MLQHLRRARKIIGERGTTEVSWENFTRRKCLKICRRKLVYERKATHANITVREKERKDGEKLTKGRSNGEAAGNV